MKTLLFTLIASLGLLGLMGCATPPTEAQQTGITVIVDAGVGYVVQKDSKDPAVWSERATKIISIAHQLQALDSGTISTVPMIMDALRPMLAAANLGPAEMIAANALVASLSQLIQQNVDPKSVKLVTVQTVLRNVIDAAGVYVTH